jgi:fatty-acyl-CoA synthase
MPRVPRYLLVSPITHAGVLPVMPTLVQGGTVVLQQGFDPERWLHTVHTEHVNYGFVVPTILYALLDHGIPPGYDVSSLETVLYGAAPMSPARIAEGLERLGPILMQGYGQTESLGLGTSLRPDEHQPDHHPELLSSCGRPVPGVRVALLDDDGQPVGPGDVGELCLRSRVVMDGYHRQPEQSAAALAGGWLHTGDLARRDDRGFYQIVDRKKDLIISGGFNIYPKEIENVIAARRDVSAVAVIGVPDDRWGEAVTAIVAGRPGAIIDPEAILREVRAAKGPHQAPKTVHIRDRLPTTPAGKIDKRALRAEFWAGERRQVH